MGVGHSLCCMCCVQEVFQLIVSSFENLSDKSSRSYAKRTSILETVAKVRSCVVMLDLECDTLIIEMFRHFLKTIRYGLTCLAVFLVVLVTPSSLNDMYFSANGSIADNMSHGSTYLCNI